jgi:hypothetical protein
MIRRENGRWRFEVYVPHAEQVQLVGDFTRWRRAPVSMVSSRAGWWTARVALEPGEHRFSYLVDGHWWLPDYAAGGVSRTDLGDWVSCIAVPDWKVPRGAEGPAAGIIVRPSLPRPALVRAGPGRDEQEPGFE